MFLASQKRPTPAAKPPETIVVRGHAASDASLKQVKRLRLLPEPFAMQNLYFAQITMLLLDG